MVHMNLVLGSWSQKRRPRVLMRSSLCRHRWQRNVGGEDLGLTTLLSGSTTCCPLKPQSPTLGTESWEALQSRIALEAELDRCHSSVDCSGLRTVHWRFSFTVIQ